VDHLVIADPGRCIGCCACMAGCVESHHEAGLQAYPRLHVVHTQPAGTMPIQCRHCEEPACAAVCPVHAITRVEDSIQLNESLCIGCKMCALACPFGAIIPGGTPVPAFEFNVGQYAYINTPYEPDSMYLREFAMNDRLSLLSWSIGQKTVAVKCDLCYFRQEGPTCIRVCPHKALSLVDGRTARSAEFVERVRAVAVPDAEQG
jgi:hydrogenase-4 component A